MVHVEVLRCIADRGSAASHRTPIDELVMSRTRIPGCFVHLVDVHLTGIAGVLVPVAVIDVVPAMVDAAVLAPGRSWSVAISAQHPDGGPAAPHFCFDLYGYMSARRLGRSIGEVL